MRKATRREFLQAGMATTLLSGSALANVPTTQKRSATDLVTLGNSGVKVSRLAFGTGTYSGKAQRALGQEGFTSLVRHAYDSGIRFFETADSYPQMPGMLKIALKGLPRDSYQLMTKYNTHENENPQATIDRLRRDLGADYVDIMLLHCVRQPDWSQSTERIRDQFQEAKGKKSILAKGASVHGLHALRTFPGNNWLDIAMIRMNHNGTHMDTETFDDADLHGNVNEVVQHTKKVHAQGTGVISMKLVGEGTFTRAEDREASMRFALNLGAVDAVTVGFKNNAEIDETIARMNRVMNT